MLKITNFQRISFIGGRELVFGVRLVHVDCHSQSHCHHHRYRSSLLDHSQYQAMRVVTACQVIQFIVFAMKTLQ